MRAVVVVLIVAACGPVWPSAGTETDGGSTGTTGAVSTSTTTTSGAATTAATGEATTAATTTGTTGAVGSTTDATTGGSTGAVMTGGTTGEALPSCCMVPDAANAEVTGATPVGPIALTWAWFGIHGGECGGHGVYVYEDPSQIGTDVGPKLDIFIDDTLKMPGTFPAWFTVTDAQGKQANIEGTVDVANASTGPFEPSWCLPGDPVVITDLALAVSFSIAADGWDVTGKVAAPYCPQLNVFCP